MTDKERDKLGTALVECHKYGDFELSSGKRAKEYYDLAPLFLSPGGLRLVSDEVMSTLGEVEFDAFGCLELCPVPLVGDILSRTFTDKRGFIVRKTRKGHGTNRLIEGYLRPNDKVVILEDVTSTGCSVMKAIRVVEELGCSVACILAVINRQEGCNELLKDYDFRSLFVKEELEIG